MERVELENIKWYSCKHKTPSYGTSGMCLPISSVVMLIIGHSSGWQQIVGAIYDGKQKKWLDPYFYDVHEFCKDNDCEPLMWAEMPRLKRFGIAF